MRKRWQFFGPYPAVMAYVKIGEALPTYLQQVRADAATARLIQPSLSQVELEHQHKRPHPQRTRYGQREADDEKGWCLLEYYETYSLLFALMHR